MPIREGSVWRGQTKNHPWLVRVRRASPGRVTFDIIEAHAHLRGGQMRLAARIFRAAYAPLGDGR